jgi:hypothetical protein
MNASDDFDDAVFFMDDDVVVLVHRNNLGLTVTVHADSVVIVFDVDIFVRFYGDGDDVLPSCKVLLMHR